jgi:excisionase family DNA binding protein
MARRNLLFLWREYRRAADIGGRQAGNHAMSANSDKKEFLSVDEVARLLGVTYHLIYRLVREGEIPASRIGKVYRVRQADLDAYLERSKTDAPQGTDCAVCGKTYASRFSIKGQCEECEAPICTDCWTRKGVRRCPEHAKRQG